MERIVFKERVAYVFAASAFLFGWVLTFISFFLNPTGEISDSVLWVLGQVLIFAGSILGIDLHMTNEFKKYKNEIDAKISKKG